MKKLLISIACCMGFIFHAQAASVGTAKIFTGNHGGVVTVQKRVSSQPDEESSESRGLVTLSDVRLNIIRTTDDTRDESSLIDEREPANAEEIPEVADEPIDADRVYRTRISGQVRFHGEHAPDAAKKLTLNGAFRTLPPEHRTLKLNDIVIEVINDEFVLSGIIVINDQEYEINIAPESAQKFVKRLAWLIRRS